MRILIVLSFWFPVLIAHAQVEEGDPLKVAGKEGARERVSEFELETPGGAHSAEQPVSSVSSADLIAKPRPNASTEKAPVSRASPDAKTEIQQLIKENRQPQAREMALKELERRPDDPELIAFVKLTEPVKPRVDFTVAKARAAELLSGMRQAAGPNDVVLASPIAWGAPAGARPAALSALTAGGAAMPDLRAAALMRDASAKISLGDFAGAEAALTRRLEQAPQDAGAWRLRSLARQRMGRFEVSIEDARRALALDGRDTRAMLLLAENLTSLGRALEGLAEAERAVGIDPRNARAYVARAAAFGALGRGEEELADLARAAALDSQFDALYDSARARFAGAAPRERTVWPVWLGSVGLALLFLGLVLFRRRAEPGALMAMRREDHETLAVVAPRLDAVPKGFRVIKTLGQGGMGIVYEAMDLALQRPVALKKLRPEVAEHPRERGRFLKEARTVAGLKHPNIVEIHAIQEDEEGLFLVFERIPGETLYDRLGRGVLPPAEVGSYLRQIASALDYAHAQGVVHQDLKPGNVMVYQGLAKVMDFGIARRVLDTLSAMTKMEVVGTPAYMAPEQENGVITPSADIFALGVCAYELLTGSLPFPNGGVHLKMEKVYRRPSEAMLTLRAGVDAAISRALEPRSEDRWPSASAFIDALSRALA